MAAELAGIDCEDMDGVGESADDLETQDGMTTVLSETRAGPL